MVNTLAPILFVEDNPDDFESVARALKKVNLVNPLKHAASAEEGLKYLRSGVVPCLVLLGLNMPGIGGVEFLKIVKQDEATKRIPVIVLTCCDQMTTIETCYAYGANSYMLKSSDLEVQAASLKRMKEYWLDTVVLPPVTTA